MNTVHKQTNDNKKQQFLTDETLSSNQTIEGTDVCPGSVPRQSTRMNLANCLLGSGATKWSSEWYLLQRF